MRVGIVAQRGNDAAVSLASDVVAALPAAVEVQVDPETASALGRSGVAIEAFADLDLVVSIGGDGTFLYAARHAGTTPVVGVNLGEVGFLNAVAPTEAVPTINQVVATYRESGTVATEPLPRLVVSGVPGSVPPAINEIVVQGPQRGRGYGAAVTVRVDGSTYRSTHADGVLVATQAGSSAYNLSEGGPLVAPDADVLVVTMMSPATSTRSLIVDRDATIDIELKDADYGVVLSDGRDATEFDLPGTVTVETAADPAKVAGPGVEFFDALDKLD